MIILIALGFLFFLLIIISIITGIEEKKDENEYSLWEVDLERKYGIPTLKIKPTKQSLSKKMVILVYDTRKTIYINGKGYKYSDIIDFNVNDQTSYKTTSSTGSMIGRGLVGGLLLGGVGALAGATTGEKSTIKGASTYRINVIMRNMNDPIITYVTSENECAQKMIAVLKNIIDYNEKIEK